MLLLSAYRCHQVKLAPPPLLSLPSCCCCCCRLSVLLLPPSQTKLAITVAVVLLPPSLLSRHHRCRYIYSLLRLYTLTSLRRRRRRCCLAAAVLPLRLPTKLVHAIAIAAAAVSSIITSQAKIAPSLLPLLFSHLCFIPIQVRYATVVAVPPHQSLTRY